MSSYKFVTSGHVLYKNSYAQQKWSNINLPVMLFLHLQIFWQQQVWNKISWRNKLIAQVLTLVIHPLANSNGSLSLWFNKYPYYFELIPVLIWLSRPENEILKFHDFPGFPWPVRTPFKGDNNKLFDCFLQLSIMTLAITSSSKQTLSTQYSSVTKATSWC